MLVRLDSAIYRFILPGFTESKEITFSANKLFHGEAIMAAMAATWGQTT